MKTECHRCSFQHMLPWRHLHLCKFLLTSDSCCNFRHVAVALPACSTRSALKSEAEKWVDVFQPEYSPGQEPSSDKI